MGGIGDGGFVATNNSKLYKLILKLKNHGQTKVYEHEIVGFNSRLDSLNAYVLNEKLKDTISKLQLRLDEQNDFNLEGNEYALRNFENQNINNVAIHVKDELYKINSNRKKRT